jgi:hypothetical protein
MQVSRPFEKHFFGMFVNIGLPSSVLCKMNVSGAE